MKTEVFKCTGLSSHYKRVWVGLVQTLHYSSPFDPSCYGMETDLVELYQRSSTQPWSAILGITSSEENHTTTFKRAVNIRAV